MNKLLWLRRFSIVFASAFLVIALAQLLRGRTPQFAALHGLVWAAISATIFVAAQAHREHRRQRCGVCDVIDGSSSESGRAS